MPSKLANIDDSSILANAKQNCVNMVERLTINNENDFWVG